MMTYFMRVSQKQCYDDSNILCGPFGMPELVGWILKPKTLGTYLCVGENGTKSSKVMRKMCGKVVPK